MKTLLSSLAIAASLLVTACGSDTNAQETAKCAAATDASLKGTKSDGATCTDVSQCKPVDCVDNTCRAACIEGKCANATDACK